MYRFGVLVPFASVRYSAIGSVVSAALQTPVIIGELKIEDAVSGSGYVANTTVTEGSPDAAFRAAVIRTERMLQILAVNSNGFQIDYSAIRLTSTEALHTPAPTDHMFMTDSVSVLKTHVDFDSERLWLAAWKAMPDRVVDALELHYLAMQAINLHTRFLILMAALERLASEKRSRAINGRLSPSVKRSLAKGLKVFLRSETFGLSESEIDRICARALGTQADPVALGLYEYLGSVGAAGPIIDSGIEFTVSLVEGWWRIRGRSAHASAGEDLLSDTNRLSVAVQTAFRYELELAVRSKSAGE